MPQKIWGVTPEMIIALCALALTVYQAWCTRRHNRLAVMPHLDWNRDRRRADDGLTLRFLLKNTGIGPAIIQRWMFVIAGKPLTGTRGDVVEELASRCFGDKFKYCVRHHSLPGVGSIMPAGSEVCVAEVFFSNLKRSEEEKVDALIEPIVFRVTYESFYRQRFEFSTAGQTP